MQCNQIKNNFTINLNNPEHVYIMGYFWADCYFKVLKNLKGNKLDKKYKEFIRAFSFEIKTEDFNKIYYILKDIGFIKFTERFRKNSKNSQSCVRLRDYKKLKILEDNKYYDKFNGCPLYFNLSEELQKYFIKGFLDGDGSICINTGNLLTITFNGKINQSWDFLEDFLNKNNIDYNIYNKSRKACHISHKKELHEYSVVGLYRIIDNVKFCKLFEDINLGVKRKIDVFAKFKEERILYQENKIKNNDKNFKLLIF